MRVIVAGATGTLGMTLTEQLIAAGHSVIGLCRRPEGADRLTAIGAEPVVADVLDEHGLLTALTGHRADAVIHQAASTSTMPTTPQTTAAVVSPTLDGSSLKNSLVNGMVNSSR
ncbi:NAD(P)H-binding protein [Nocardia cyriacigeorgica]|nr:NAD(P)H-binding protein [Nocardia cyriacigeorgica]